MSGANENLGAVHRVPLDRTGRWALLREPAGHDEECVGGRGTLDAVRLLDRLLVDAPGASVAPGRAIALTVPERDVLLAAVYRMAWGPKIGGTQRCTGCNELFDFEFELDALVDAVQRNAADLPAEQGIYMLPGGCRFRLPTGEDEQGLIGVSESEADRVLLERCLVRGDPRADGPAILDGMERVGAGIDVDLTASCAACAHPHVLRFQIQEYLLGAISASAAALLDAVHRLALAYGWSLREILALPTRRRRALVALLAGDPLRRGVLS